MSVAALKAMSEGEELLEQSTTETGNKQSITLQKRQSSIIPAPQYYRWERQCDECGRVFAYLNVHLSKSKLCRAAYDLKELREQLKRTEQAAVNAGMRPQDCQEKASEAADESALTSAGAPSAEPPECDAYEHDEEEEEELTVSNITMLPKYGKSSDAAAKNKLSVSRTVKREGLSSTADQLTAMQQQLREFHKRLNKCEVMSKRRRVEINGNSSVPCTLKDDSGVHSSPSMLLKHASTNRVPALISKRRNSLRAVRRQPQPPSDDFFSDDDDGELEILGENYLLSAQSQTKKRAVHKTYIEKAECRHCGARMKYILSHLSKSFRCQVAYDMTRLRQQAEDNKRIRQKYYLKHLKRKRKRPEVFEIVEQVGPRGNSRSVASNLSLQRKRGRGQSHFTNVRRRVQFGENGGQPHNLSNNNNLDMEDEYTKLPHYVPQVTPLAGSSSAPRRLFSGTCHVTASGPASCHVGPVPSKSEYPHLDSSSSHSEDEFEPLNIISTHVVEDELAASIPKSSDRDDGILEKDFTAPDHQSITRLKRPSSRVIRLTKAGKRREGVLELEM